MDCISVITAISKHLEKIVNLIQCELFSMAGHCYEKAGTANSTAQSTGQGETQCHIKETFSNLTLIRVTKDEKGLAFFKGLLL